MKNSWHQRQSHIRHRVRHRIWNRVLLFFIAGIVCSFSWPVALAQQPSTQQPSTQQGISQQGVSQQGVSQQSRSQGMTVEQAGTPKAYFAHNGEPLLSFGGLSDFIFYADSDAFDYRRWADWSAEHGMNHVRAYPPLSWKYVEKFARENGGSSENLLFPYKETTPGSRQFDLTQFDDNYWNRFREQCEYLQSKGIIIHLLMVNGWQLDSVERNWGGHFFNPANNVNDFTDVLADNRLGFYDSVAEQQTALISAQKAWLEKLVETTADLDNVYYDLVHEIAENHRGWPNAEKWIEVMAAAVRSHYTELQPNKSPIIGMDAGGLSDSQRDWIFSRPYFDLLIYGKFHVVNQAKNWRNRYNKPYIPQESWDEDNQKYGFREPDTRVHLRKYLWKFMMAKCQQMDVYIKPMQEVQLPGYEHNYDPNGWTPFEEDALILRETWDSLIDYPNLLFEGEVTSGPGSQQYVLSADTEALVYLSSAVAKEKVSYNSRRMQLKNLALQDGTYRVSFIKPDQGLLTTGEAFVSQKGTAVEVPEFVDDLAIHLVRAGALSAQDRASQDRASIEKSDRRPLVFIILGIMTIPLGVSFITYQKNKG